MKKKKKKRMTCEQFYKILKSLKKLGEFEFCAQGSAYISAYKDGCTFCPITAVASKVTGGEYFPTGDWPTAAREIGLNEKTALHIVNAADGEKLSLPVTRKHLRKIVKALDLEYV